MKTIKIEIELTENQCDFLKNLVVLPNGNFTYNIDDYDMYNDLVNKGVVVEFQHNYGEEGKFLSDLGLLIKKEIN